jgi:hypothetical protein
LPVMGRVVWELGLNASHGECPLCDTGVNENVTHVLLHCPAHQRHRSKMVEIVNAVYATANDGAALDERSEEDRVRVLLGARAGGKVTEDIIDAQVKRFLVKAWKIRRHVSAAINDKLGRKDIVWAKKWGGCKPKAEVDKEKSTAAKDQRAARQGWAETPRSETKPPCRARKRSTGAAGKSSRATRRLFF